MKHTTFDWPAAWAVAIAMVAVIGLVGTLPRGRAVDHIDVSRSENFFAEPSHPRMIVDRDEPLVDPADSMMVGGSDLPEHAMTARPVC